MHLVYHQVQSNGSKWLQMAPSGSKWLQMAPNYSKWFQMTMAVENGSGNGPTLSQMVPNGPNGPELSIMIQHSQKWSNIVPESPK